MEPNLTNTLFHSQMAITYRMKQIRAEREGKTEIAETHSKRASMHGRAALISAFPWDAYLSGDLAQFEQETKERKLPEFIVTDGE